MLTCETGEVVLKNCCQLRKDCVSMTFLYRNPALGGRKVHQKPHKFRLPDEKSDSEK